LPDDILTKVDRTSMAVSLETRVPLLDHRIVELGWSFAPHLKHNGKSKIVMRDVLKRYVPPSLFERPKMGFGIPLQRWLTGPLRDWSEATLSNDNLVPFGIEKKSFWPYWQALQNGEQRYLNFCWSALAMAAWHAAREERCRAGKEAA
jgi:asparagine synthase (glutamine-hydrolysing)